MNSTDPVPIGRRVSLLGASFLLPWLPLCAADAGDRRGGYSDGRSSATLRLEATDAGVILRHGGGPGDCDQFGAREALIFEENGVYHLFYDGAGPRGWLACLATSKDLQNWEKAGPILDFGRPGENDSAAACSPWVYSDGTNWHMFYLGTPKATPAPHFIPSFPYLTMKAKSSTLGGPWIKQPDVVPFTCQPGTYYGVTASPGHIARQGDEYLMFFSAAANDGRGTHRTLGVARTKDLDHPWILDPGPIVPAAEQIENASLYYEPTNRMWFLFTNHIGLEPGRGEYTDAVWVYWTHDLNQWNPKQKAVVLDGKNCSWSKKCIGMPSVIKVGDRLAILYDAPGGESTSHMNRDLGLAWLNLPLAPPDGSAAAGDAAIDSETRARWSAPYRGWHYWPDHVVPARPVVGTITNLLGTDVPTVYQIPGSDRYYMSFIGFDGRGYQSFVAESDDLVRWGNYRLAMGYGPANEFDHGGRVIGAFLYESYDIKAPRRLKRRDGLFWTLYGAYPRQGGYELRPGYEGVAVSDDGFNWRRAQEQPILSVHDAGCGAWEKDCIYQPWLLEHAGQFLNFYNAAAGPLEQTGVAFSSDLFTWTRHAGNPVIPIRPGGYDERFSSDPKVFRDGDHWTMFYFGVGRGGAHIMVAFSRDLLQWTADPEPLYKAGGNPSGLDRQYAHKTSLVYHPPSDTFYLYYNAVPGRADATGGRGIGLLTSRKVAP